MHLRLTAAVRDDLIGMARAALPNEACGYVVADGGLASGTGVEEVVVAGVHPVANAFRSPTTFALDPGEMLAAEDAIESAGRRIVGLVHSHPTSAPNPSARDLADAAIYDPQSVWVQIIVSLQGFVPAIGAWRYPHTDRADLERVGLDVVEAF